MLKKLFILLCITIFCGNISASENLPKEIVSQLNGLYVFQDGLARPLKVTVDEANLDCLNGKRLFPYSIDGQVMWFGNNDFLPTQMSNDEQLFIRKTNIYLSELAEQGNFEELTSAIKSIKAYQKKNGGTTLPSAFAEKTDFLYCSRASGNLIPCILAIVFIAAIVRIIKSKKHRQHSQKPDYIIAFLLLFYSVLNLVCRWIIGRHIPLTSNYEILTFLTFCLTLTAILQSKRNSTMPFCNLISTAILLFSNLLCNTSIKALNAALDSPLLGYHVAITIISYAIFFIMALNGMVGLTTKNETIKQNLRRLSSILLLPGIICLAIGIIIGSVWAKTAWGSYWNWDPKETWALITLLVYSLGLFASKSFFLLKDKRFHIFCIIAFAFVIFTFFGVNYLFEGFHSSLNSAAP